MWVFSVRGSSRRSRVDNPAPARVWESMQMDWRLFLLALGLALVIEGAVYFLGAERVRPALKLLAERPAGDLRKLGLTAIILGLLLIYFVRA